MSVSESPNSPVNREEALTILYHLEKLFAWITKVKLYSPLRTMDMISFFEKKALENPDADLLEVAQAFICEHAEIEDFFSAVDKAGGKSEEFEKLISFLEGRKVSALETLNNEKTLADTVREFQQHVTFKLGKMLRIEQPDRVIVDTHNHKKSTTHKRVLPIRNPKK